MALFSGSMKQTHIILVSILLEADFKHVFIVNCQTVFIHWESCLPICFSLKKIIVISTTVIVCSSHTGSMACGWPFLCSDLYGKKSLLIRACSISLTISHLFLFYGRLVSLKELLLIFVASYNFFFLFCLQIEWWPSQQSYK